MSVNKKVTVPLGCSTIRSMFARDAPCAKSPITAALEVPRRSY
jgi:hypothetical protein